MKKCMLMASVAVLAFGITSESWAAKTCDCGEGDSCCWGLTPVVDGNNQPVYVTVNGIQKRAQKLTISGSGTMSETYQIGGGFNALWEDYLRSITTVEIEDGITNIGDNAFSGATNLTSVSIPDSVTRIGSSAFSNSSSLSSITIPDSVKTIEYGAFSDTGLTDFTFPSKVTSIADGLFQNVSSLTSITIPEGVYSIGNDAFRNATSLTSITIPDSVTWIGNDAFYGATSLTEIIIPDSWADKNLSLDSGMFEGLPANTKISCQGNSEKCEVALAKLDKFKSGGSVCEAHSNYCINANQIVYPVSKSYCANQGKVFWEDECVDEYPFSRKHWTPAEVNKWLKDDDNTVTITFKIQ